MTFTTKLFRTVMTAFILVSPTGALAQIVVENPTPLWKAQERWRLSAQPILQIGADVGDPNYEFGYAHGPVRLADGRIVVADMQSTQMRFYDPSGKFLMSTGRKGGGPGEFEQLYRLRKIDGDSLMALEPASLTSIYSPAGKFIRRFSLKPLPRRPNLWWIGRLSDGTLVGFSLVREGTVELAPPADAKPGVEYPRFKRPDRPPTYRDTLQHFLFDMQGNLIDSIARLPAQWLGDERVLVPNAAYAFYQNMFYHSPGDIVEIRAYRSVAGERRSKASPVMQLERIIHRAPIRSLTVNDSIKNEYVALMRARYARMGQTNPQAAEFQNRQLANTKYPERFPAHNNRMYADALGNLWLQEYQINPAKPTQWSVFEPNGRWLGVVETPGNFTVNEIGADYVLGVYEGDLGVQYVRMYRLVKPAQ